jgi:hypothetical protein
MWQYEGPTPFPEAPREEAPLKLLLDTNVVLDVLLDRPPHSIDSAKVMSAVELGTIEGSFCATTVTTIHYLPEKTLGAANAAKPTSRPPDPSPRMPGVMGHFASGETARPDAEAGRELGQGKMSI